MYEVGDVRVLSFEITYEAASESWYEKIKSIERGRFLSGSVTSELTFDKGRPMLVLAGEGFGILVSDGSILMTCRSISERLDPDTPLKEPLSQAVLKNLSTDFNMAAGIVLGALGVPASDTSFKIEIGLRKEKVAYQDRSVEKTLSGGIQPRLGRAKVESASAKFVTSETFLENAARVAYDMDRAFSVDGNDSGVAFFSQMKFGNTGPQDLELITVKYIDRINEVIGGLTGGMKAVE